MQSDQLNMFYELSAALTGFEKIDLLSTGVGAEYLDELLRVAGQENVSKLLDAAAKAGNTKSALQRDIWKNTRLGPMARNIVRMWYLGTWYPLPESWHNNYGIGSYGTDFAVEDVEHVVSTDAYREGLVWPAMRAHPPGAKQPGFASWATKPVGAEISLKQKSSRRKSK